MHPAKAKQGMIWNDGDQEHGGDSGILRDFEIQI